jgi:hypothetical protein
MKHLKSAGLIALAAAALLTFGVNSAAATTVESGGFTFNSSISFDFSIKAGFKLVWKDTAGFSRNECSTSKVSSSTSSPFTGSSVTGAVSSMAFENCTRSVTVHKSGSLEFTYTSGTNATVASEGTEVTVGSAIGTLTCKTGETTNLGTATGVASGNATIDVNSVLNCGIIPSLKWEGYFTVTGGISGSISIGWSS